MQQNLQEHQQRAERIEELIQQIGSFPDPRARATTEELLQALLDMYGEGLGRILELTAQAETAGLPLIEKFADDGLLGSLFLLHGLHPIDIETRITKALDEVRPYLKSHRGNVEFVRVEDGIAYLRLEGSCHGCPSSTMTLKLAIEEAIYKAAPDLDGLEVEGVVDPPRQGVPITLVPTRRRKESTSQVEQKGAWSVVAGLNSLPDGSLKMIAVQDQPLLFCRVAATYYAYRDRCSSCRAPLNNGRLAGTSLICPSCGLHFDICRAGRCLDAPTLYLEPVPLLVENGIVKVALSGVVNYEQAGAAAPAPTR